MAPNSSTLRSSAGSLLLVSLLAISPLLVAAHGAGEHEDSSSSSGGGAMDMGGMGMSMDAQETKHPQDAPVYPPTYFAHTEYVGLLYAHIILMIVGWIFLLPIGVMLSIARSRYTLLAQFVFLAVNAIGVLLITIYNADTPDLYPNNAHHTIGWIATLVVSAQVLIGVVGKVAGLVSGQHKQSGEGHSPLLPTRQVSDNSMYLSASSPPASPGGYRHSDDETVLGNNGSSEYTRSNSISTLNDDEGIQTPHKEYEDDDAEFEELPLQSPSSPGKWTSNAIRLVTSRAWKYIDVTYKVINRIILPFGFMAFTSGIVTYGRFFEGPEIFGGLAHWVKGGVFFWLGLFTLGRWAGSFGEMGWAWNIRPKKDGKWRPSAEFVESFLIFFYGATNIFLEHLGSWGGSWSAQDLEHVSITVLFIGGGLCGMLIESTWIRELLNMTVIADTPEHSASEEEREERKPPASYEFSINPIPALVILLLGIMMGSHHQSTMISTMVHKQWGNLLAGASLARGFSYIIMYLKPPTSTLPSRPPTELLASFGLIAGGVIFMASAADCITGMIHYDLDAMFVYTVVLGFTGLLMSWELIVLAIKGWAVRKERRAARFH